MLESRVGQTVPDVTFTIRVGDAWQKISSDAVFKGKTVVLFALPGAFTPTCSSRHLPRYNELAGVVKANGVDSVVCLAVNDHLRDGNPIARTAVRTMPTIFLHHSLL